MPVPLAAAQVACAPKVSYALLNNGTVRAWGNNDNGALGAGSKGSDAATPVAVQSLAAVVRIEAGGRAGAQVACAVSKEAAVSCWGSGTGPIPTAQSAALATPTVIPELAGTVQLALGSDGHGCAALHNGTAQCWGDNTFGELGTGDTVPHRLPEPVTGLSDVAEIRVGANHSCALLADGTVKCWGSNATGCVHPRQQGGEPVLQPVDVGIEGATQIALGSTTSCAIARGALTCWGGWAGTAMKQVDGLEAPMAVAANGDSWCAIDRGRAKCWGPNRWGQVGNGTRDEVVTPTLVDGLGDATAIGVGERHACAVATSGAVFCWGYNQRGELGDGTLRNRSRPVAVAGLLDATLAPARDGYDEVEEAPVEQRWSNLPNGCKHEDELALRYPHTTMMSLAVRSAYARRPDPTTLELRIATYRMDPADLMADEPRAAHLKLTASFHRFDRAGALRQALDAEAYSLDGTKERRVIVGIHSRSHSYVISAGADDEGGTIALRHIGDDWVCGHLALRTKTDEVRGDFAAQVVP